MAYEVASSVSKIAIDYKALITRGDHLLTQRGNLLSFWQDSADNFYPERADFTLSRSVGQDFASHLQTSYPIMVRRELAGAISSMLRPRDSQWGTMTIDREDKLDSSGRQWLEYATKVQWRAMYDRPAMFVRSTHEGDQDFTTFGQTCITRDINYEEMALLYRTHHLRDAAIAEDRKGQVCELHLNWKPTLAQLATTFGEDKLHRKHQERLAKEPFCHVNCRRIFVPTSNFTDKYRQPYLSIYLDCENDHLLEVAGRWNRGFIYPRWQTVSGSPYAYSPAVVAGLPDARLIQAMTLTLLEAGELAVRPPLLGRQDVIRGDANYFAGGITWANLEGDEKLDNVLRPIFQEKSGIPLGLEMNQDTRAQIAAAFYLNKLQLPPADKAMTAYEISQRLEEWIRAALPLVEPMEQDYNGWLCEDTFEDLMRVGAFGPLDDIPESIRGAEVRFRFESPLHKNIERRKAHTFLEARDLVLAAMDLDKAAIGALKVRDCLTDALSAVGVEAKYVTSKEDLAQFADDMGKQQQMEQAAPAAQGIGMAAEQMGKGKKALEAA